MGFRTLSRSWKRQTGTADANQPEIVEALKAIGCEVYDIEKPVDLLVEFRRIWILLEVKNPEGRNRLEPDQVEFFKNVRAPAEIVRTPEEAVKAVQSIWKRVSKSRGKK